MNNNIFNKEKDSCSFCGRTNTLQDQKKIIQGQGASICEDCITYCYNFLNGSKKKSGMEFAQKLINPPTPVDIKNYLDTFVIGQSHAKKVLSVAAYNHYKRVLYNSEVKAAKENKDIARESYDDMLLEKSNILLVGPTGSGKTLLARTLAEFLNVPLAIADATSLTEAGYVGEDVEHILLKLYQAAGENVKIAQQGIIFIDEIDKISRKSKNPSITRDVSGEGVQQALLKIIEGTLASVPPQGGRKHPHQKMLQIDTSNILFICGGAFVGLEDVVKSRVKEHAVGFDVPAIHNIGEEKPSGTCMDERYALLTQLHPEDLIHYGFVPELIGRLPITAILDDHTEESLRRVLIEPKNAIIKQVRKFFQINNVELEFENGALDEIARRAFKQKVGARGLRTIVEDMLLNPMYSVPSETNIKKIRITKNTICSSTEPLLEYHTPLEDSA